MRYSTLLRRANKVGGDKRMEKVILMPVYNKSVKKLYYNDLLVYYFPKEIFVIFFTYFHL